MEGAVVIVHADVAVRGKLEEHLAAAGAETIGCPSARRGLNTCCALEPIGLVTHSRLPDHDAVWLVAAIRAQPTAVAAIPVLVLCGEESESSRREILAAGADALVRWPIPPRELAARVEALVALVLRTRDRGASSSLRPDLSTAPPAPARAFSGSLDHGAIATVLAVLELDRATGQLELSRAAAGKRGLVLELAAGAVIGGRTGADPLKPLEAVDAAVHWGPGRYRFAPGPPQPSPEWAVGMSQLLRASMRPDEPTADEAEQPPTRPRTGRVAAFARSGTHGKVVGDAAKPAKPTSPAPLRDETPRRATLLSQPAQKPPPAPPTMKRRMSEQLRSAITVEESSPKRSGGAARPPPLPRTDADAEDAPETEVGNQASTARPR